MRCSVRAWLGGALLLLGACAKIVGITDTVVMQAGAAGSGGSLAAGSLPAGSGGEASAPALVTQGGSGGVAAAGMGGMADQAPPRNGGSGGGAGGEADAGMDPDAAPGGCGDGDLRCGAGGREVCTAGAWQSEPCPVAQPTCQGAGECIVRGPALVAVADFFVDATEVTEGQYREFVLAKNGDMSGQSPVCTWNQTYDNGVPVTNPDLPVGSVDWCDAAGYCAWAGKRLCGRIGGGSVAYEELFDQTVSEWFLACGGPGGSPHPSDVNMACNSNGGFGSREPVATNPDCEGRFTGLFDLEGNVAEWVDSCTNNTGPADTCYLLGGSYIDNFSFCTEVYESEETPFRRDDRVENWGFRCCAG